MRHNPRREKLLQALEKLADRFEKEYHSEDTVVYEPMEVAYILREAVKEFRE